MGSDQTALVWHSSDPASYTQHQNLRSPNTANTLHITMSDEEFYEEEEVEEGEEEEEEEYEEEVQTNPDERKSVRSAMSEGDGNFLKARQEAKKGELDEQLREYINEWRK